MVQMCLPICMERYGLGLMIRRSRSTGRIVPLYLICCCWCWCRCCRSWSNITSYDNPKAHKRICENLQKCHQWRVAVMKQSNTGQTLWGSGSRRRPRATCPKRSQIAVGSTPVDHRGWILTSLLCRFRLLKRHLQETTQSHRL